MALLILVLVVLPGAMYTWAFERQVSGFGVTLADRTLRLIATSLLFHLVAGWVEYWLYRTAFSGKTFRAGQFAAAWLSLILIVAVPILVGTTIGSIYSTRHNRTRWAAVRRKLLTEERETKILKFLLGRALTPRAWDHLFSSRPSCYIRVWTTEGKWVAGLYANKSHAAGVPYETDLYLEEAWSVDDQGALVGDTGLGYSIYLPAGKISRLEVLSPEKRGPE